MASAATSSTTSPEVTWCAPKTHTPGLKHTSQVTAGKRLIPHQPQAEGLPTAGDASPYTWTQQRHSGVTGSSLTTAPISMCSREPRSILRMVCGKARACGHAHAMTQCLSGRVIRNCASKALLVDGCLLQAL